MTTSSGDPHPPIELFRYLRTLVDTAETSRNAYPKFALVEAYWHIGRIVVETEQAGAERADYGIHLIELLSEQLTVAFGRGYSLPNMWRFKQFYLAFQILSINGRELPNLQQHLRTELSWSHYRLLMQLENLAERAFYIQQAADERWTVQLLQKLVRSRYYYQTALGEDHLLANTKKIAALTATGNSPTLSAIGGTTRTRLATIKKVLLERYVCYAFVGQRQFVSVAGEDRWAELVFFHVVLHRYIIIELAEHSPSNSAKFRLLLNVYTTKQPPGITNLPIGLLVNQSGSVKYVTTSDEIGLTVDEESTLPHQFL